MKNLSDVLQKLEIILFDIFYLKRDEIKLPKEYLFTFTPQTKEKEVYDKFLFWASQNQPITPSALYEIGFLLYFILFIYFYFLFYILFIYIYFFKFYIFIYFIYLYLFCILFLFLFIYLLIYLYLFYILFLFILLIYLLFYYKIVSLIFSLGEKFFDLKNKFVRDFVEQTKLEKEKLSLELKKSSKFNFLSQFKEKTKKHVICSKYKQTLENYSQEMKENSLVIEENDSEKEIRKKCENFNSSDSINFVFLEINKSNVLNFVLLEKIDFLVFLEPLLNISDYYHVFASVSFNYNMTDSPVISHLRSRLTVFFFISLLLINFIFI